MPPAACFAYCLIYYPVVSLLGITLLMQDGNVDAQTLIKKLGLLPLSVEGGYFIETYRCDESIPKSGLPGRYGGDKAFSTAIYYLLTADTFSTIHRLISDEIFHFYTGDPVEMLHLYPDGSHRIITIGSNIEKGEIPQAIVPKGVWQGCRIRPGGRYALLGTTVAPAFDYEDYENGEREWLIADYPECAELIKALTKD